MALDAEKYLPYFDDFDLSEDQKRATIEALWIVAETFADLAFGLHPSQQLIAANDNDSFSESNVLQYFKEAAADPVLDGYEDFLRKLEGPKDKKE
ncbi:hypothetical protein A7A08_02365 [Methyloligella halotolerans]|uniref:Uncharacterized protein n=1 Tax=Methyloligella halotolerans TaxID=1177755 RepID=A0A1E2RWY8_9HYPH|nr:hypothetical protein [Methyloligella halotolerans]ODA66598.1 hypothetical protein A7A08_02365 [Methyloligella halotolerans]